MTDALDSSPCPQCGELVPVTVTTDDPAAQSAPPAVECPHCGAALVRAVAGPADQGWRLADE
jgi:endogenous inhibitor of DNA gyrase (YacG/DUF329 family)